MAIGSARRGVTHVGLLQELRDQLDRERARWGLWVPVAFASGIGAYFASPMEPPFWLVLGLGAATLCLWRFGRVGTFRVMMTGLLTAAACGVIAAKWRTETVAAPTLPNGLPALTVNGWVEKVELRAERDPRITLRVQHIARWPRSTAMPHRVRFSVKPTLWPGAKPPATSSVSVADAQSQTAIAPAVGRVAQRQAVQVGDAVRVMALLSTPPPPVRPGDYDFPRRAYFERLGGVGFAIGPMQIHDRPSPRLAAFTETHRTAGSYDNRETTKLRPLTMELTAILAQLRTTIANRVEAVLPGDAGAVAIALIIGDRGLIPERRLEDLRAAGLAHVLAISGLHLAIMAGAAFWIVRVALALIPALALRLPIKAIAGVAALLVALIYLAISGGSLATQRATLMLAVMVLATLMSRPAISLRNVGTAALIILIVTPEALLDAGFQMSFAAVTGLVAVYASLRERAAQRYETAATVDEAAGWPNPLQDARASTGLASRGPVGIAARFLAGVTLTTVVAGLAVGPIAAYHFNLATPYSVVGNLLAIPIVTFAVLPSALLAVLAMPFGLETTPLVAMGSGIDAVLSAASAVAGWDGADVGVPQPSWTAIVVVILGALWWAIWQRAWRWIGAAVAVMATLTLPFSPQPDVLIAPDDGPVAIRLPSHELSLQRRHGRNFAGRAWLQADGDRRPVALAAQGRGFQCDPAGCTATVNGRIIALPRTAAAAAEDCLIADAVISAQTLPATCTGPIVRITPWDRRHHGAHELTVSSDGTIEARTSSSIRGRRPWTAKPAPLRLRRKPVAPVRNPTRPSGPTTLSSVE